MSIKNTYIFVLFISCNLSGQGKLAIVNSPTGYVEVLNGPGSQFEVSDTLQNTDLVNFVSNSDSKWDEVVIWNFNPKKYIESDNIIFFNDLDIGAQKEMICDILQEHKSLAESFEKAYYDNEDNALEIRHARMTHAKRKFHPILTVIPNFICQQNDGDLLKLLLQTLVANAGSAYEGTSYTLGDCMVCDFSLVIQTIDSFKDKKLRTDLYKTAQWLIEEMQIEDQNKIQMLKTRLK